MTCKQRIMLTGTPLQNDLQELQNLLGFLLPDIFKDDAAAHLADVQVRLFLQDVVPNCLSPGILSFELWLCTVCHHAYLTLRLTAG